VQPAVATVLADFGRRLLEVRRERGWTQQAAAEKLGWGVRDYRAAELGDRNLTIASLAAISRAFDLPIADLFTRPERPRARRRRGRPRNTSA
jgi:transcriptional regulator with XRE-family HTH domain